MRRVGEGHRLGEWAVLPLVTIVAAIVFFALWRSGFLDELSDWGQRRKTRPTKELSETSTEEEMAKRLEVFEEFIDELPDEDLD